MCLAKVHATLFLFYLYLIWQQHLILLHRLLPLLPTIVSNTKHIVLDPITKLSSLLKRTALKVYKWCEAVFLLFLFLFLFFLSLTFSYVYSIFSWWQHTTVLDVVLMHRYSTDNWKYCNNMLIIQNLLCSFKIMWIKVISETDWKVYCKCRNVGALGDEILVCTVKLKTDRRR